MHQIEFQLGLRLDRPRWGSLSGPVVPRSLEFEEREVKRDGKGKEGNGRAREGPHIFPKCAPNTYLLSRRSSVLSGIVSPLTSRSCETLTTFRRHLKSHFSTPLYPLPSDPSQRLWFVLDYGALQIYLLTYLQNTDRPLNGFWRKAFEVKKKTTPMPLSVECRWRIKGQVR